MCNVVCSDGSEHLLGLIICCRSIVVSTPACHVGDPCSIPSSGIMHYFLSLKSQGSLPMNIDWSIFIWIVLDGQIISGILSDVFILNLGLHSEGLC